MAVVLHFSTVRITRETKLDHLQNRFRHYKTICYAVINWMKNYVYSITKFIFASTFLAGFASFAADLRLGIIGCDTSHVIAFTELLNNPDAKGHVPGGKVVAAFRGGSPDIAGNSNHIKEYSTKLKDQYGVKFYETIQELCENADAIMLESVDGRPHLDQVKPVIKARKPVYIDKPMAGSLRDVIEIFALAKKAKVPVFSSSSLRFAKDTQAARAGAIGIAIHGDENRLQNCPARQDG